MHPANIDKNSITDSFNSYNNNGWCVFKHDQHVENWVSQTLPAARQAISAPQNQQWLRHGGTWFAGVNVLENDRSGKTLNGIALTGNVISFIQETITKAPVNLDRGQLSVCYPGYPKQSSDESDAAHGYRLRCDAAHVDGLLKETNQQRYCREYHDYILAIPMSNFSADAAPFVVWSGSHKLVQSAFQEYLNKISTELWSNTAITECYTNVRKRIFNECERIEIALKPGEAFVGHRLLLHGTRPWHASARADQEGRLICFFRPASLTIEQWLNAN